MPRRTSVLDPVADVHDLLNGYWRSQVLCAAARLGVPDLLSDGPMTGPELAAESGIPSAGLERLMRALVAVGVCAECDECYRTTALGRALEAGAPGGAHERALLTAEQYYTQWADLTDCVCRDTAARGAPAPVPGVTAPDREQSRRMAVASGMPPIPAGSVLVDVGGGASTLLAELLCRHLASRGVVYGRTGTIAHAHAALADAGVGGRVTVVDGEVFHGPPSGDLFLLSVLHQWDDEQATSVLEAVRSVMRPSSRLLVIEQMLPERANTDAPPDAELASLHDLHALVTTGGRERTASEYVALLAGAGLRHNGTPWSDGRLTVLEADACPQGPAGPRRR